MSLVGNLADLGLGDIFQIVSLSRRSGSLKLDTPAESGEIVFVSGKVVAAERSRPPHTVGDVLLHMGVVTPRLYQEMLAQQARGVTGADLFAQFNLDPDTLDRALESLLTRIVYEMFEWEEGSFSFVLAQDPPLWTGFSLTAARVVLARGLNPQYLAIEGARIRDERQRQDPLESFLARSRPARESSSQATAELSSALRADPELEDALADESPPPDQNIIPFPQGRRKQTDADVGAPEVAPPTRIVAPPSAQQGAWGGTTVPGLVIPPDSIFATSPARAAARKQVRLVVVDDDVLTARLIAEALGPKFAAVHTVHRVGEAIELVGKLAGQPFVLAVDLIMPRTDGRGILGGVEVIAHVRQRDLSSPIIAFSDYKNEEAEARAKALGVATFLGKPKKRDVAAVGTRTPSEAMRAFMRGLADASESATREEVAPPPPAPVGYRFAEPPRAQAPEPKKDPSPPFTIGELEVDVDDLAERADRDLGAPPPAAHFDLSNLRSMLAELIDPANRDTITLLVLRYASDVFERGGLFLATRRAFVGLGGFLNAEQSDGFVALVRRIQIPVEHDSVFAKVAQYRSTVRGPLVESDANRALLEGLGGWHGYPTVAIPIVSGDRVAAILFGDNPSGKPLGATDSLEIFLQQAGLAMDRALLERRLEESKKNR